MANLIKLSQKPSQANIHIPGLDLSAKMEASHDKHQTKGQEMVFRNVGVRIEKRDILQNVNGLAKPGEMLAIMGPSGAGKTTLLNCLAGRKPIDSGSITVGGRPLTKQMRRKISYVLQQDIFLSQLTCWDTIWTTAMLRLPGSMPESEKRKRVYEIIDALDMRKCLNTRIGDDRARGLSGGERKRTTIACELLTNPALMLLDEPTSGLDSSTAYSLCSTLKKFAKVSGKTVVMTIHQPSSQIFNMFDKLLLLCDGQVAFYGDVTHCASFFSDIELPCPPNYNLADHILDQVKDTQEIKQKIINRALQQKEESWYPQQLKPKKSHATVTVIAETTTTTATSGDVQLTIEQTDKSCANGNLQTENGDLHNKSETDQAAFMIEPQHNGYNNNKFVYAESETGSGEVEFEENVTPYEEEIDSDAARYKKEYDQKWPTGFWLQYTVLAHRAFKQAWPRILSKWNVSQCTIVAVFGGMLWFKIKPEEESLTDRHGMIFFSLIFNCFVALIDAMLSFPAERTVLNKERLAGYYRLSAWYIAKSTIDWPLVLLLPAWFVSIVYWLSGINYQFVVYIQYLGITMLTASLTQSMGFLFASLILEVPLIMMTSTTTMLVAMLAGGFYAKNVPFWAVWMKFISFVQYAYYSLLNIDMNNSPIREFIQAWPRILSKWNVLQCVITALFGGMLWFQIKPVEESIADRHGMMFFCMIYNCFFAMIDSMLSFPAQRNVLNKERLAGYYRLSAYYLAKSSVDWPLVLTMPCVVTSITFWMSGISYNFWVYLQHILLTIITCSISQSMGFLFGALILKLELVLMSCTTTMLFVTLAGGYYAKNVPFWAEWMKYASFISYSYYGLLAIDITHTDIRCSEAGSQFHTCFNQTLTANNTQVEQYIDTQEYLDSYTFSGEGWQLWHYIMVLASIVLLERVLIYVILRYIRKPTLA